LLEVKPFGKHDQIHRDAAPGSMRFSPLSPEHSTMKIVALDLGKFKTVACIYLDGESQFVTLNTSRQEFTEFLKRQAADVVVFETCTAAGWLSDLCDELDQPFFVANPNGEAWKWSTVKRKTHKDDALKLAKLTAMNQLPTVHVPSRAVRAKRSLLNFRKSIVTARVKLQNEIRALWQAQGLAPLPSGKCGWTKECIETLKEQSRPLTDCNAEDFWRGQRALHLELRSMRLQGCGHIDTALNLSAS
jgi:transposase